MLASSTLDVSDDARPSPHSDGVSSSPVGAAGPSEASSPDGAIPIVLDPTLLRAVLSFNDAMLVSWFATQPASIDALSVRERTHALGILSGKVPLTLEQIRKRHTRTLGDAAVAAACSYIRQQLAHGDHQTARARQLLEVGATIKLGRRHYRVVVRGDRRIDLIGERGGRSTLYRPMSDGGPWLHWTTPCGKYDVYDRDDAGAFTARAK